MVKRNFGKLDVEDFYAILYIRYPTPPRTLHSSMVSAFDKGHSNSGESKANSHLIGAKVEKCWLLFQIRDAGHSITKVRSFLHLTKVNQEVNQVVNFNQVQKRPDLKDRRSRGDIIEVYMLISGKETVDHRQFFQISLNQYNLRGYNLKLVKKRPRLDSRKHFCSQRIVNVWNSLPQRVVIA